MSDNARSTEVLVIGGGPGGYGAAFRAADLGKDVTIVDPEATPGGVCVYRGCIPTKALLHAAETLLEIEAADEWGLSLGEHDVDIGKLREWKSEVVQRLTKGLRQLSKQRNVRLVQGTAHLMSTDRAEVSGSKGDDSEISYQHVILATGAQPRPLPNLDFSSDRVWSSKEALELPEVPEKLLVVGGGYIGLELGTVYAALGSKVTISEIMPTLLPNADRDVVRTFTREAKKLFHNLRVDTTTEFEETDDAIRATFTKDEEETSEDFDRVLLAVGRAPKTEGLGLENTDVKIDENGFVVVDEQRRTEAEDIYAVGDITGNPLLAHKAVHEGRVAAEAIAGRTTAFDPSAIPAVEYTSPEVAWCGMTERRAEEVGREVETATFPWTASGRNVTLGKRAGMTKLVIDPETERIIGGAVVGTNAGELISEISLAVEMAATVADVSLTVHPHPTLSETIMQAAQAYHGTATDIANRK